MLVAHRLRFKFLQFNALPHNPEGSGEGLQGHYGPLVSELCSFLDLDFYPPFFDLHFLSSIKHPTVERWHPDAVLLFKYTAQ